MSLSDLVAVEPDPHRSAPGPGPGRVLAALEEIAQTRAPCPETAASRDPDSRLRARAQGHIARRRKSDSPRIAAPPEPGRFDLERLLPARPVADSQPRSNGGARSARSGRGRSSLQ